MFSSILGAMFAVAGLSLCVVGFALAFGFKFVLGAVLVFAGLTIAALGHHLLS